MIAASGPEGLGLVLDLSHTGFGAVLDAEGETCLHFSARPAGTRHDDAVDWIEARLRLCGGGYPDLKWICAGRGPGSFTGIRIALALAQGIALPRRVPLYGFTSFEALFLSFPEISQALAVIPANAGRFYVSRGLEDPGALIDGEALTARASGSTTLLVPSLSDQVLARSGVFAAVRAAGENWDAVAIARRARRIPESGADAVRPYYLQVSAAEEKFGAV